MAAEVVHDAGGAEEAGATDNSDRIVLLVPHTRREGNIASANRATELLLEAGLTVRLLGDRDVPFTDNYPALAGLDTVDPGPDAAKDSELVLVLGGDGTFLGAAGMAREQDVPVLGINLGHIGFLAEWEEDSLETAIRRVIDRNYRVVDRMTIDLTVHDSNNDLVGESWALNEASLENIDRSGVLDAILEVDFRPVSSFGCDGVLISTPTGSTAYAFSAGGPILWPELDAILVVPNNAHALFTTPLVVSPQSTVAVESLITTTHAKVVADGIRQVDMPPGSRLEVVHGHRPVRLVRLDDSPFTDRLVRKLHLPVNGWRGPVVKDDNSYSDSVTRREAH